MDVNKKKMDPEKKIKLIYSGELLLFAIIFLVLGTLLITGVIHISGRFSLIFRWVTIFGGSLLIADFLWALFSRKRQKRIAIIDKIVMLPVALYLITYDIFGFVTNPDITTNYSFYQFGMPVPFLYIALAYTFESLYHWSHPVPGLLDDLKEEKKEENHIVEEIQKEDNSEAIDENNETNKDS